METVEGAPVAPRNGCVNALILALLALWFLPPLVLPLLTGSRPLGALLGLVAHLAVYLPAARWAGRWRPRLGGAAFGLAAVAGYLALLVAAGPALAPPLVMLAAGLIYELLLVAPLYARWRGSSYVGALRQIGLLRPLNLRMLLLALALAAPFVAPWVVVGALGASAQTRDALLATLASVLPLEILLRGFVLSAYRERSTSRWPAIPWSALVSVLLAGGLAAGSQQLSLESGFSAVAGAIGALPSGILLGTLQAGTGGYLPATVLLALAYRAAPALMIDPRSSLELTFLLVRAALGLAALLVAGILALARAGLLHERERAPNSGLARPIISVVLPGLLVAGLYIGLGAPGVYEDGFVIVLKEQADLSDATRIPDRVERLRLVYKRLTDTAARSQAPLRARLDQLGVRYRPYYLINMIRVDGRPGLAEQFAGHPEVARIERNPNVRPYKYRIPSLFPNASEPPRIEPSLERIGVAEAWALGVYGRGVLVAGADSGYAWDHPALKSQYAGWDGVRVDHNYHWHDAWDGGPEPLDDEGHGTHTMGTIVGDDGISNHIGLAPEARWIGCRNMRHGLGNPASYVECLEFFLAPYPYGGDPFREGDPSRAPMVVNNSWGCPEEEGCAPDTLLLAVEHLRAAGVMMVVSAGNEGPDCSTVSTAPGHYSAVFSVGALDEDNPDTLKDEGAEATDFSSRGPVIVDGSGRVKPDISAPGQNIRSSIPGGYAFSSGTSMAGPHVAGMVALLLSADPSLIGDVDGIEQLIRETARPRVEGATPCGPVDEGVPNDTYGSGEIDVATAIEALVP